MAGGMDLGGGGKGKKRSLDTAINLVPFIDLMAVTISFLIMTAVWNEIARLTVSQAGGPSSSEQPQNDKPTLPLNLVVTERGFSLNSGGSSQEIPKVNNTYVYCHASGSDVLDDKCEENTLVGALKKIKADVPDQRNITVQVEDGIKYKDLVKVIDVCNLKDNSNAPILFPDVSVSAVG
jgi:biopolymer transport protein ExbD